MTNRKKTMQKVKKITNQKKNNKEEQNHQYLMQSRICPGITNAGCTCFFASIIQILANTQVPSILSSEAMTRIPNSFFNILNIVFQQLLSDHDVTKDLVEHTFAFFPKYNTKVQSDANEFFHYLVHLLGYKFSYLFAGIHDEIFRCTRCGLQTLKTYLKNKTTREYGIETIFYEKCFPSF